MKIKHKENPIPLRKASYPNIGDQLDAIHKGFEALQMQGFLLPEETIDWINEIRSIKSTFKKES